MKTAVLISGHMRSFERCLPTLHWHVFRHFATSDRRKAVGDKPDPDSEPTAYSRLLRLFRLDRARRGRRQGGSSCDFFVSTEPDADAGKADLLCQRYGSEHVYFDDTPQPDGYLVVQGNQLAAHAAHAPYAISVPPSAVLGQLWRLQRCWDFASTAVDGLGPMSSLAHHYDLIIRCRPDLWMESCSVRRSDGPTVRPCEARTPWWGRFGGVNDRFAIFGREAAQHYFTTWSKIQELLAAGCPLHPESLIKASLEAGGCEIDDTLDVSFSTLRANGERRFPEIMAQDIGRARH